MLKEQLEFQIFELKRILKSFDIDVSLIEQHQISKSTVNYVLDKKYLMKISTHVMEVVMKLERVKEQSLAPKVLIANSFEHLENIYYFIVYDYLVGDDLDSVIPYLSTEQSIQIGKDLVEFIAKLNTFNDLFYDIGHYIPTIPRYEYSWQQGHLKYVQCLSDNLETINMSVKNKEVVSLALTYIYQHIDCLKYQEGPKLLHNDLHPKNIIVDNNKLVGVIDWECSQFGELDFELSHLFHWCIYPSIPDKRFELLLKTVFKGFMSIYQTTDIGQRLTIYQLEHELNQIIWNNTSIDERITRIKGWKDGQLIDLISKW